MHVVLKHHPSSAPHRLEGNRMTSSSHHAGHRNTTPRPLHTGHKEKATITSFHHVGHSMPRTTLIFIQPTLRPLPHMSMHAVSCSSLKLSKYDTLLGPSVLALSLSFLFLSATARSPSNITFIRQNNGRTGNFQHRNTKCKCKNSTVI